MSDSKQNRYLPRSLDKRRITEVFCFSPQRKRELRKALERQDPSWATRFENDFDQALFEMLANPRARALFNNIAGKIQKASSPLRPSKAIVKRHLKEPPLSENPELHEELVKVNQESTAETMLQETVGFFVENGLADRGAEVVWCTIAPVEPEDYEDALEKLREIATLGEELAHELEPMIEYLESERAKNDVSNPSGAKLEAWPGVTASLVELVEQLESLPDRDLAQAILREATRLLQIAEAYRAKAVDLDALRSLALRFSMLTNSSSWDFEGLETSLEHTTELADGASPEDLAKTITELDAQLSDCESAKQSLDEYWANLKARPTEAERKQLESLEGVFAGALQIAKSSIEDLLKAVVPEFSLDGSAQVTVTDEKEESGAEVTTEVATGAATSEDENIESAGPDTKTEVISRQPEDRREEHPDSGETSGGESPELAEEPQAQSLRKQTSSDSSGIQSDSDREPPREPSAVDGQSDGRSPDSKVNTEVEPEDSSLEQRHSHLLKNGRFGCAYWLNWAADLQGLECPLSPALLGAVASAQTFSDPLNVSSEFLGFADEIIQIPPDGQNERILAATALVTGAIGSGNYVQGSAQFHSLANLNLNTSPEALVDLTRFVIDEVIRRGWTPKFAVPLDSLAYTDLGDQREKLAHEAAAFLETLPNIRFSYQPAHQALLDLFSRDSEFGRVMRAISNSTASSSGGRPVSVKQSQLEALEPEILFADLQELTSLKAPLQGNARTQFLNKLKTAHDIARRWILLSGTDKKKRVGHSDELDSKIRTLLENAVEALTESSSGQALTATVQRGSALALSNTLNFLNGEPVNQSLGFGDSLQRVAAVELDENFKPIETQAEIITQMESFEPDEPGLLVETCIDRREFARAVEYGCHNDSSQENGKPDVMARKSEEIERLLNLAAQTEEDVEEANLLGLLDTKSTAAAPNESESEKESQNRILNENRSKLLNRIQDARQQLVRAEQDDHQDIRLALRTLEDLSETLHRIKQRRRDSLRDDIEALIPSIPETSTKSEDEAYIRQEMEAFLTANDNVALAELFETLSASIAGDAAIPRVDISKEISAERFFHAYEQLAALQKPGSRDFEKSLERGANFGPLLLSQRSKPHREAALEALKFWHRLKNIKSYSSGNEALRQCVGNICSFLGLIDDPSSALTEKNTRGTIACFRLRMSPLVHSPVPSFGSELGGELPVLLLKDKTLPPKIMDEVKRIHRSKSGILVIHLGALSQKQRLSVRDLSIKSKKACAILDFPTLAHAIGSEDPTQAFFDATIPFTWSQPYLMTGENVPPEMFVGREDEIHDLLDREGSCIVFGGRQLGKSALLRHLANEHHEPASGLYISYLDIDDVGNPPQSNAEMEQDLWMRVYNEMLRIRFIPKDEVKELVGHVTKANASSKVRDLIHQRLNKSPDIRFILLLDETDDMLEMDSQLEFRVVRQFRGLMAESHRRFKVVFTGLQSVQRYRNYRNQPFTQLGSAIVIRPLPPKAGQKLVQLPMRALGYSFEDSSLIMRILSQANYHPGLVQIFCYRLLENLNDARPTSDVNKTIGRVDVNRVERNVDFMEDIRNRFDWTLDLDKRYKVLIYALVLDNRATLEHNPRQFKEIGSTWWPQVFENMDLQTIRGILDEMEGLGVLLQVTEEGQRRYRLRSPNLLRLLGSKSDIESEMMSIIEKRGPTRRNPRNFRLRDSAQEKNFGALTMEQDSQALDSGTPFRAVSISGSGAMGVHDVSQHLRALFENQGMSDAESQWREIIVPPTTLSVGSDRIIEFLKDRLGKQNRKHLFSIIKLWELPSDLILSDFFEHLTSTLGKTCKQKTKGRVFLLANEDVTWRLLKDEKPSRELSDDLKFDEIHLRRWSDGSISKALDELGLRTRSDDNGQLIFQRTGGLHSIVQGLLLNLKTQKTSLTEDQIFSATNEAIKDIRENSNYKCICIETPELRSLVEQIVNFAEGDSDTDWATIIELLSEGDDRDLFANHGLAIRNWLTLAGVTGIPRKKDCVTVMPLAKQLLV